uniref:Uncharacterized protein n=1 Tax=Oryza rufipogon TaxID=4529 RepID=A0A0E0RGA0_ORYRU
MTASWLDYSRLCAPGTLKTLVARGLGQRRLQSTGTAKWPTAALWTSRAASSLAQGVQPALNGKFETWIDQNFGETRLLQGGQGFDGSMFQVPRLDYFLFTMVI